jgi:hypothetical protein
MLVGQPLGAINNRRRRREQILQRSLLLQNETKQYMFFGFTLRLLNMGENNEKIFFKLNFQ